MDDTGGGGDPPSQTFKDKEAQSESQQKERTVMLYDKKDIGPFFVYVESQTNTNIGRFSHLKIACDIFNLKLNDVKKIRNKGLNRLCIEFYTFTSANALLKNTLLIQKGYKIFIPLNFTTSKSLVRLL